MTVLRRAVAAAVMVTSGCQGLTAEPPGAIASPATASAAASAPLAFPPAGPLESGVDYTIVKSGISFTISVPISGWFSNGEWGFDKGFFTGQEPTSDQAGFIFWDAAPVGIFADPCAELKAPPAGPTAADRAEAVAAAPGTELIQPPTPVTVGGYPAQHVAIRVPADVPCGGGPDGFQLWYEVPARYATAPGATEYVWIVDVDGTLLWIDGETFAGAEPSLTGELQQVVDSIQFE
jgi:hypothetical protein